MTSPTSPHLHELFLVPRPGHLTAAEGTASVAAISALTASSAPALRAAERFRQDVLTWAGIALPEPRLAQTAVPGAIHVRATETSTQNRLCSERAATAESYTLSVREAGVSVDATTDEGAYRGLTTLLQLICSSDGTIPLLEASDRPRYGWRGLSYDVARSFSSVDEVKQVIDLLSLYKGNVLHLHLTNNEGWRLELPSWPRLTPDAAAYFTTADLRELIAYAAERFVTLVPEINVPGHVGWAIRQYPELNPAAADLLDSPFPPANLDVTSEAAWRFVDDVIEHLASITPGPYLHVGGDEAFGMADADHAAFVDHVAAKVTALGKIMVGWQETSRASRVGPGQVVQHWIDFMGSTDAGIDRGTDSSDGTGTDVDVDASTSTEGANAIPAEIRAMLAENFMKAAKDPVLTAANGSRVVMSPTSHAYVDRPHAEPSRDAEQDARRDELGLPYYPATPLSSYLEWDPVSVLPAIGADQIAGVEAALWTETANTPGKRQALLLPRVPAVLETAWSTGPADWESFRDRIRAHGALWDDRGLAWYQTASVDWTPAGVPVAAVP